MTEPVYKDVGKIESRYEDVAQDGRVHLNGVPPALSAVWKNEIDRHPAGETIRAAGIVPILSRIEIDVTEESFSAMRAREVLGSGMLLVGRRDSDEASRALIDVRSQMFALTGHAILPFAGERKRALVGTMLGEHILTRLFATDGNHRVLPSDLTALGVSFEGERVLETPQSILVPPTDCTPIDREFQRDSFPLVFGLVHTDSNQHVNSLVYPRIFEEAILRRLHALRRSTKLLSRSLRIGYRKPSFAGETAHVEVQLYAREDRIIALGALYGEGETDHARARVYVKIELRP